MRRSFILSVFLLTALILLPSVTAVAESAQVEKTTVSVFQPSIPGGPRKTGECWTDSIAVLRPGAWRCMVGNAIYDPCFSRDNLTSAVICGANPANDSAGFVLRLTKPLPKPSNESTGKPRPWLVELGDKTICEIQTGTIAFVAGITVPYGCSDSQECSESGCPHMTGLTEEFEGGAVWTADKITFSSSKNGLQLIKRSRVPVSAVWR